MRLHRRHPTRFLCPWDTPGENTGVGCHFLLQCMKVKSESEVAQSCPTLCDPIDRSPPGSSIHGIFQARVLEWGAIAFSSIIPYRRNILANPILTSLFSLPLPNFIPSLHSPNGQHLLPNLLLRNLAAYVTKQIQAIRKDLLHTSSTPTLSTLCLRLLPCYYGEPSCSDQAPKPMGSKHLSPTQGSCFSPCLLSPAPSHLLSLKPFPST